MAQLNLITTDDHDQLELAAKESTCFDSLLADDVVMQWLMDLEAAGLDSEGECEPAAIDEHVHA